MAPLVDVGPRKNDPGDDPVVDVGSAGVTVVPPPGWRVLGSVPGLAKRTGSLTGWLELIDEEVCVTVRCGRYRGSADALLEELLGLDASTRGVQRRRLVGIDGWSWSVADCLWEDDDFIAAAVVVDCSARRGRRNRLGIEVVAEGSRVSLIERTTAIDRLIASIGRR